MRLYVNLIMAVLYLFLSLSLQAQVLEKKITMKEEKIELGQALKKLKENYGIKLSYANNTIPEKRIVSIDLKNAQLKEVLNKLFAGTNVSYQIIGDQVVLKNEKKKEQKKVSGKVIVPDSSKIAFVDQAVPAPDETVDIQPTITVADTIKPSVIAKDTSAPNPSAKELKRAYRLEKKRLKYAYMLKRDSLYMMENNPKSANQQKLNESIQHLKMEIKEIRDSIHKGTYKLFPGLKADSVKTDSSSKIHSLFSAQPKDSSGYKTRLAQVTFVSPIGTNGVRCGRYVNILSFNILGGYAAGLRGFEFAGLVNVEKDYVYGVQFAGLVNAVRNEVRGGQFSGLINLAGKNVHGGQFAGFANFSGDSIVGAQVAGFSNFSYGSFKGAQISGFCNVVTGNFKGTQISFINVSPKEHQGIQIGFINFARVLKGGQFGFLNVSDSAKGIPVGFLSIVRTGYHKVEFYGAESMYGNIAFKTGAQHFYNIIYAGAQLSSNYYRWAFGYGFGTEQNLSKKLTLGLDLLSMHVNENQSFTTKLNLLNQARLNLGLAISPKTSIFIGPTFNVMVSQFMNPDYVLGSGLGRGQLYNVTSGSTPTNVKMWVGFHGGMRF
jgi:hypothetical protein